MKLFTHVFRIYIRWQSNLLFIQLIKFIKISIPLNLLILQYQYKIIHKYISIQNAQGYFFCLWDYSPDLNSTKKGTFPIS